MNDWDDDEDLAGIGATAGGLLAIAGLLAVVVLWMTMGMWPGGGA